MTEAPTAAELEALVNGDAPEEERIKAVPVTIFTVVGRRFHVPDFNAWGYIHEGRFVFADGFFVNDDGEPEGPRQDILLPSTSLLWVQLHFDALNESGDVIDGTALDGTEAT